MPTTSNTLYSSRTVLRDAIPLPVPLAVYFDLANQCNFHCPWCPTGNELAPEIGQGQLSLDLFKKIINDFDVLVKRHDKKIKTLNLFWMGEPLLNKNFYEMASLAKQSGIADRVAVTTNGSLLNQKNAQLLLDTGIDVVQVSFYGSANEDYSAVHKSINFDKIVNNLNYFISLRKGKGADLPLLAAKFFEKNDDLEDILVNKIGCVDVVSYESPFNWSDEYSKKTGNNVVIENHGPMEICPSPWFVMSIGWDGHVGVCCADWKYDINVGNLKNQSVTEIWNGDDIVAFRKKISNKEYKDIIACNGCTYFRVSHDDASNIDSLISNDLDRALSTFE